MIVFLEAPSAFAALPDQVETALAVQIDVDDRHVRLELRNARQSFRRSGRHTDNSHSLSLEEL